MSDRLKNIDTATRLLIITNLAISMLGSCVVNPMTPGATPSPEAPKPTPTVPVLPDASATPRPDATHVIVVTSTLMPTVEATSVISATSTPEVEPQTVPAYAVGNSLEGAFAGVGGVDIIRSIGLPNDPAVEQLVKDGYKFVMDPVTGLTGQEITINGVTRIEAPAVKSLAGEVDGQVVTFSRPDEAFATGGVTYFNEDGTKKMVFGTWYSAAEDFIGVARRTDGILVAVYKMPDGSLLEVAGHTRGPMNSDIAVTSDAEANIVYIDGQAIWDANQPVHKEFDPASLPDGSVYCMPEYCYDGKVLASTDRQVQDAAMEAMLHSLMGSEGGSTSNKDLLNAAGITNLEQLKLAGCILPTGIELPKRVTGDFYVRGKKLDAPLNLCRPEFVFLQPGKVSTEQLQELVPDSNDSLVFLNNSGQNKFGVSAVLGTDGNYRLRFVMYSRDGDEIVLLPTQDEMSSNSDASVTRLNKIFMAFLHLLGDVPAEGADAPSYEIDPFYDIVRRGLMSKYGFSSVIPLFVGVN